MPIFTTYLGFLNKHGGAHKVGMEIGSCFIYYVMRNRGNNEVAPTKDTLDIAREMTKRGNLDAWEIYKKNYFYCLTEKSFGWMEKRAGEAKLGNILLVCYEGPKYGKQCHRFLLAEEIAKRFNVEYKGEVDVI